MAQLSYPGVYIDEIPSGVHAITGVPTSVAAFVGYTPRGLENTAKLIFSWADFERGFGGLASDSELGYGVQGFFANGGGQAWIVRVPKSDATKANITIETASDNTGVAALTLTAISSGAWGNNVVADIDYDGIAAADTTHFNLTITDLGSGASERFTGLTLDNTKAEFVDTIVNDKDNGSQLVHATAAVSTTNRPVRDGAITDAINYGALALTPNTAYGFKLQDMPPANLPATDIEILHATEAKPDSLSALARLIQIRVNAALNAYPGTAIRVDVTPNQELKFTAVFDQALFPGTADTVLSITSPTTVGLLNLPLAFTTNGFAVSRFKLGSSRAGGSGIAAAAAVGADGTVLPATGALIGDPAKFTGIYALDKAAFNVMAIPDATRAKASDPTTLDPTVSPNDIYMAAMKFCSDKRAFLVMDTPPKVASVEAAMDWRTTGNIVRGTNGAMYFPRVRIADPLNDYKLRTTAPSGFVAGLYARTDGTRGVWKAPAGIDAFLNGVTAPAVILSDPEHGVLNPIGLNCFRAFPIYGNVTWGARTLAGSDAEASDWKYIPVRRTALFIEESLYQGTKWAVFEPNDEGLWAQLRLNVGAFMHSLFVQKAFQGSAPKDAYLVKCDKETTPQNDINNGIVNVYVGFAPLKPAEFVVLKIQQLAGQIQT